MSTVPHPWRINRTEIEDHAESRRRASIRDTGRNPIARRLDSAFPSA